MSVTDARAAAVEEWNTRWVQALHCLDPVDPAEVKAAVELAYNVAGHPPPQNILLLGSPLAVSLVYQGLNGRLPDPLSTIPPGVLQEALEAVAELAESLDLGQPFESTDQESWRRLDQAVGECISFLIGPAIRQRLKAASTRRPGSQRALTGGVAHVERMGFVRAEIESVLKIQRMSVFLGNAQDALKLMELVETRKEAEASPLRGQVVMAMLSPWWIPFRNAVLVSNRPCVMKLDLWGALHAEERPALAYRDGWKLHAIHGVHLSDEQTLALKVASTDDLRNTMNPALRERVLRKLPVEVMDQYPRFQGDPAQIRALVVQCCDPLHLTATRIRAEPSDDLRQRMVARCLPEQLLAELIVNERNLHIRRLMVQRCPPHHLTTEMVLREINQELRRLMLERIGLERMVREFGECIHEDRFGRLLRITVRDQTFTVVQVTNKTPNPDGTFRVYLLHVPPTMTRARQAVAWTFGLEEAQYHPDVET